MPKEMTIRTALIFLKYVVFIFTPVFFMIITNILVQYSEHLQKNNGSTIKSDNAIPNIHSNPVLIKFTLLSLPASLKKSDLISALRAEVEDGFQSENSG